MKFLAVFAAIVAVATANNVWTVQQLSDAISSPHTDATLKPHLVSALDQFMDSLWAGHQIEAVTVEIPSANPTSLTLNELSLALQNPETDPALIPYLEAALNQLMDDIFSGKPVNAAVVASPAMEIHHYTLHELSMALQDSTTEAALIPYLEHALNVMMEAAFSGEQMSVIVIAVPAAAPEAPELIAPVEIEAPEAPAVPETPAAPASPLVQIIININQQESSLPAAPVLIPAEEDSAPTEIVDIMPVVVAPPQEIVDITPVVVPTPQEIIDITPVVVAPPQEDIVEVSPVIVAPPQIIDVTPVVVAPPQIVDVTPVVVAPPQIVDVTPVVVAPPQIVDVTPVVVAPPQIVDVTPVVVAPPQFVDSAPVAAEPVIIGTPTLIKV